MCVRACATGWWYPNRSSELGVSHRVSPLEFSQNRCNTQTHLSDIFNQINIFPFYRAHIDLPSLMSRLTRLLLLISTESVLFHWSVNKPTLSSREVGLGGRFFPSLPAVKSTFTQDSSPEFSLSWVCTRVCHLWSFFCVILWLQGYDCFHCWRAHSFLSSSHGSFFTARGELCPSAGIVPLPDRLSFRCMDILFLLLIDGAEWHAWVTQGFAKRSTNESALVAHAHGCVSEMIDA